MAGSIFDIMQEIEAAAQAVIDDYDRQKCEVEASFAEELAVLSRQWDQETERQAAELEASASAELATLKKELETESSQKDQAVREVLTDQKAQLVNKIIEKAVLYYGRQ